MVNFWWYLEDFANHSDYLFLYTVLFSQLLSHDLPVVIHFIGHEKFKPCTGVLLVYLFDGVLVVFVHEQVEFIEGSVLDQGVGAL